MCDGVHLCKGEDGHTTGVIAGLHRDQLITRHQHTRSLVQQLHEVEEVMTQVGVPRLDLELHATSSVTVAPFCDLGVWGGKS